MLLFTTEDKILDIKRKFEQKTGLEGALTLYDIYNKLMLDLVFDFKLSLEFKIIIDTISVSDFGFDIGLPPMIPLPPVPEEKTRYGFGRYGLFRYDPEVPPPRYTPTVVQVFTGPDAWKEKAIYELTYKYTSHQAYYFNQSLAEALTRSRAYREYFSRSPEYELDERHLEYACRVAEFIYVAACWFDFNSFDLGRFWPGKVPLRFPKEHPEHEAPSDVPYFDLDLFDSGRFDEMHRLDVIIWLTDPFMTGTRFDLAIFDASRFDRIFEDEVGSLTNIAHYLKTANLGEKLQTEVDDYRRRADALVAAVIWAITSDRFKANWVRHGVRMLNTAARISNVLQDVPVTMRFGYQAFARELRTRAITLGHADEEQLIRKYVNLGLDEGVLRRIARMVERL